MSADCQKIRSVLGLIRACRPTGVTEEQILSMAIAKHLGMRETMSYDARDFPHEQWNNNNAYLILRCVPKFRDDMEQGSTKLDQFIE